MFDPITALRSARILISNDDGILGPGLAVLEGIARSLCDDVWVCVPETEQSGAGHSLSLHRPLRIRHAGPQRYAVDGTPTDSVLLAVNTLFPERKPDLILSGVNRGANLGDDVTYSGTVAAAMEGTLLGIPSIAFSQVYNDPEVVPWETAQEFAPGIIERLYGLLQSGAWPREVLMNVNFPPVPPSQVYGVQVGSQGTRKVGDGLTERLDPRGKPYIWIGPQRSGETPIPGSDMEAIDNGFVSVTPLCVNLTDRAMLDVLKRDVFT